jgi:hypothetical protein
MLPILTSRERASTMADVTRNKLTALWLCALYFVALSGFFALVYTAVPTAIVSDHDPSKMTKADLIAIASAIARTLKIVAVLTSVGTVALIATAVWIQSGTKRDEPPTAWGQAGRGPKSSKLFVARPSPILPMQLGKNRGVRIRANLAAFPHELPALS